MVMTALAATKRSWDADGNKNVKDDAFYVVSAYNVDNHCYCIGNCFSIYINACWWSGIDLVTLCDCKFCKIQKQSGRSAYRHKKCTHSKRAKPMNYSTIRFYWFSNAFLNETWLDCRPARPFKHRLAAARCFLVLHFKWKSFWWPFLIFHFQPLEPCCVVRSMRECHQCRQCAYSNRMMVLPEYGLTVLWIVL